MKLPLYRICITVICFMLPVVGVSVRPGVPAYSKLQPEFRFGNPDVCEALNVLKREIERLRVRHSLADNQIRRLLVAAKGAAELHVRNQDDLFPPDSELPAWIGRRTLFYCQQEGTVYLGEDAIDQCLCNHPLWLHAVQEVLTPEDEEEVGNRSQFQQRYVADTVLLAMDSHLALTETQRAKCRPILAAVVKRKLKNIECRQANWMLLPVAAGVDELPENAFSGFLRPDQIEIWNGVNSVLDLLRDMDFNIPDEVRAGGGFGGGGGFF